MDAIRLPTSNQLYVIVGGSGALQRMLTLAARLALRGGVWVLDCGNRANPLPVVRELRRLTIDPVRALANIQTARAFTCYQVLALLEQTCARQVREPVVIFDLLASFYDESVRYDEGQRLLAAALGHVRGLLAGAPVMVSVRPPPSDFPERAAFVQRVCAEADQCWVEEAPSSAGVYQQGSLWT